jgi:hypothetical protein
MGDASRACDDGLQLVCGRGSRWLLGCSAQNVLTVAKRDHILYAVLQFLIPAHLVCAHERVGFVDGILHLVHQLLDRVEAIVSVFEIDFDATDDGLVPQLVFDGGDNEVGQRSILDAFLGFALPAPLSFRGDHHLDGLLLHRVGHTGG